MSDIKKRIDDLEERQNILMSDSYLFEKRLQKLENSSCEHDWEHFCLWKNCVKSDCQHRGRFCNSCGIDKLDASGRKNA